MEYLKTENVKETPDDLMVIVKGVAVMYRRNRATYSAHEESDVIYKDLLRALRLENSMMILEKTMALLYVESKRSEHELVKAFNNNRQSVACVLANLNKTIDVIGRYAKPEWVERLSMLWLRLATV